MIVADVNDLVAAEKRYLEDYEVDPFLEASEAIFARDQENDEATRVSNQTAWRIYRTEFDKYRESMAEDDPICFGDEPEFPVFVLEDRSYHAAPTDDRDSIPSLSSARSATDALQIGALIDYNNLENRLREAARRIAASTADENDESAPSAGRPPVAALDGIIIRERAPGDGVQMGSWCIACDHHLKGKHSGRVAKHARSCKKLQENFSALYANFFEWYDDHSNEEKPPRTGTRLAAQRCEELANAGIDQVTKKRSCPTLTTGKRATQPTLTQFLSNEAISGAQQAIIDLALCQVLILAGLPFALLDNIAFINFCSKLRKGYNVPDRSSFATTQIMRHASNAQRATKEMLRTSLHLSLTFDGWSSEGNDEVYTFHLTTMSRVAHLMKGEVARGASVTSALLSSYLNSLMTEVPSTCVSAIISDTTANVKKARADFCTIFKWVINIPDPCHSLNLLAKDCVTGMGLYETFAETLSIITVVANYFSRSNSGSDRLHTAMKALNITRGIETMGNTRFSTVYRCAISIERCIPAIEALIKDGEVAFPGKHGKKAADAFKARSDKAANFRRDLTLLIDILKPVADGLKTLEGAHVTCSDVFNVYAGIAARFNEVLNSRSATRTSIRNACFGHFNRRFKILMSDCSNMVFLVAAVLDPVIYSSNIFNMTLPARTKAKVPMELMPAVVQIVVKQLCALLSNELARNKKQLSKPDGQEIVSQFSAYLYREAPFDRPCKGGQGRLKWWQEVEQRGGGHLLAKIGIKLLAICPSEMADERTASRMGWYNSARRNSMAPETIIQSCQLYDAWSREMKGSEPKTAHHSRLELGPEIAAQDRVTVVRTPAMADLLNPTNEDVLCASAMEHYFTPEDSSSDPESDQSDSDDELDATPSSNNDCTKNMDRAQRRAEARRTLASGFFTDGTETRSAPPRPSTRKSKIGQAQDDAETASEVRRVSGEIRKLDIFEWVDYQILAKRLRSEQTSLPLPAVVLDDEEDEAMDLWSPDDEMTM